MNSREMAFGILVVCFGIGLMWHAHTTFQNAEEVTTYEYDAEVLSLGTVQNESEVTPIGELSDSKQSLVMDAIRNSDNEAHEQYDSKTMDAGIHIVDIGNDQAYHVEITETVESDKPAGSAVNTSLGVIAGALTVVLGMYATGSAVFGEKW